MKNRKKLAESTIKLAFVIVMVLVMGGIWQAFAAPPADPPEAPPAALYAVSWNTAVMTQTTNATAITSQHYAYQDVTCSFDFYDPQTVTVTLQASNDNSGWFQTHAFTAVTTDTTATTGIILSAMRSWAW